MTEYYFPRSDSVYNFNMNHLLYITVINVPRLIIELRSQQSCEGFVDDDYK